MGKCQSKIYNFKLTYTPGLKKITHGADGIKPFLRELKQLELQRDVNNITLYYSDTLTEEEVKEVLRRFAGVYHAGSEARFFLAAAQLKKYNDFLSEDSDEESQLWVSSALLNSAIINYQSLFDLILQVSWIYHRIYSFYPISQTNTCKLSLTSENLNLILHKCKWDRIESHKDLIDSSYFDKLKTFYVSDIYIKVNDLANSIKHRQRIAYQGVAVEDQILIKTKNYCSADTNISYTIDDVISLLKDYHSAIYDVIQSLAISHRLKRAKS